jgi:hypothetical protein
MPDEKVKPGAAVGSGVGTAATVGGGTMLAAWLVSGPAGLDPATATMGAMALAWLIGAVSEWARHQSAEVGAGGLLISLLAKLG